MSHELIGGERSEAFSAAERGKDRAIKWMQRTWCQSFWESAWARREAWFHNWLPIVCHIVLSRLIETLTSFLIIRTKKKKKLEIFQALNFHNAALNYAAISQLFISVAVLRPCFKKHAKWEWAERAVSTHFTQNCLLEKFVSQCRFLIFLCVLRAVPVTAALKWSLRMTVVSREEKQITTLRNGQYRSS